MRSVLMIAMCLSIQARVAAQCSSVAGVVKDASSGDALAGATLRSASNISKGTIADANGKFTWTPSQDDSLLVSFIGYEDALIVLDNACELEIKLYAVYAGLEEVEIKSERLIAEEFTVSKIKKLEIYTNPSAKADPLLAVNSLPSATTTDESANISLRGGSPNETGIFLNNVPINDAVRYAQLNGIGTFSIFNTALISQVQVFPGNPPLEFGNTTSGLIALTTDEDVPTNTVNTLSASLASFGYYTSRKVGQTSAITAFTNYQPSVLLRWFNPVALDRIKRFNTFDAGLHFISRWTDRIIVKFFAYANSESFLYESRTPTFSGNFNQEKTRCYTVTNIRHRFRKSELSFNNGLNFSRAQFSLSTLDANISVNDFYASLNYQYFGTKSDLKMGLSYDYRSSDFNGQFPRYSYALGEQFPVDRASTFSTIRLPEAYVYGKLNVNKKWILGGGLRRAIHTNTKSDFWSSQMNVNFRPSAPWNFILSVGRYNKLLIPQGTASIEHLQTDQFSVDASLTKKHFESTVSLFAKRGTQGQQQTSVQGIELYGRYRINKNLRTQLSITSLHATQTLNGETLSSPFDIRYFIRGNVEYKFAGTWTATLVFLTRQGSFYFPVRSANFISSVGAFEPVFDRQARLPDYHLLDFSISKLLAVGNNASAVVFFGVSNVPNFQNVRGYTYDFDYTTKTPELFAQRTIYFGMVVNF